jgi:hypothetical protein
MGYLITPSNRLLDVGKEPWREFFGSSWDKVKGPLFGWEIDPRDDDLVGFDNEEEAIAAWTKIMEQKKQRGW